MVPVHISHPLSVRPILKWPYLFLGAWGSTSRAVPGSNPGGVGHRDFFRGYRQNHVPWSQLSLGVKAAGAWGWRPTTLVVPNVKKSGALTYPDPLGPSRRPVVGETFTFTYFCIAPARIDHSHCVVPHTFRRTRCIPTIYCGHYISVLVAHLKCILWKRNYWSWTGYQKALCCRQRTLRGLSQYTRALSVNVSTEVRTRTFPPKILSVCNGLHRYHGRISGRAIVSLQSTFRLVA